MPLKKEAGNSDFTVKYQEFVPEQNTLQRTVLIFPPTGGITYLEKSYARLITEKGGRAIVLTDWTGNDEDSIDLVLHQRLHTRAMRALDIVLKKIEPDGHKISLMGTSVGAIFTAVAANKFPQIERALSIAGGIPIPEVIATSNYTTMQSLRKRRQKIYNFKSQHEYANAIDKVFELDPLKLPPLYKEKKRAMVILTEDEAVPTKNQLRLRDYWQPEKVIEMDAGHFWGIIKTWWFDSDDLVDFLI